MKVWFRSLCILLSIFLTGCASTRSTTVQTTAMRPSGIDEYKRAFIQVVGEDEFRVSAALTVELNELGLEVLSDPPKAPRLSDLRVRVTADGGWDFKRYLQSLELQFSNAETDRVEITTYFYSNGIWMGTRDARLKAVFNDLRVKLGKSPSKQFQ